MSGNTFGNLFRLTTFGESHGPAIGGVIDGCPAGLHLDFKRIQSELDLRRPGQSSITTGRKETDQVEFLSGTVDGITTGTPLGFIIRNEDQNSEDYDHLKSVYRPSHADFTYEAKYGLRDHKGGGRSSARETACRVVAGAVAHQLLELKNISSQAWVDRVQDISISENYKDLNLDNIESNIVRCPDEAIAARMIDRISEARENGDSLGGSVFGLIKGVPAGLGSPVYDKLGARLGYAMLGINAVKAFESGSGIGGSFLTGSAHNDAFENVDGDIRTRTNNSGGIQGGISNGEDIWFRVTFKPTATIASQQDTVNTSGEAAKVEGKGRHDPCVLPRAVPIVKAMASLVMADAWLLSQSDRIE
jgi:chorismate synthase